MTSSECSAGELADHGFAQPNDIRIIALDLSDMEAIDAFVRDWSAELWGLVNNAGICMTLPLESQESDPFEQVLAVNMRAPYYLTKGLLGHLSSPGRIVNIASQLGVEGRAGYSAYCASKFAIIGMTKCWAKELGTRGITVNAVCPGWVDTEMSRIDMARMARELDQTVEDHYAAICAPLELKRFNSTSEVASLVTFLLSEEASGITGRDWLMQTVWNQL